MLFDTNHTILLAVSGGKDSFTLVDVLAQIHNPNKLIAVTAIEGITIPGKGYRHVVESSKLKKHAKSLGVDYIVASFMEVYDMTLDSMVSKAIEKGLKIRPCTFCGVIKRRILNMLAKQLGADRVATAHNLDDEAQTAIMNILRGDRVGLIRQHPIANLGTTTNAGFVPRIKPLRKIYEWESMIYALKSGYDVPEGECPYLRAFPTLRLSVRLKLYEIEWKRPGTLLRFMEWLDYVLEPLARELAGKQLPRCERCSEPTSPGRRICKACELLESIGIPREPHVNIPSIQASHHPRQ